MNQFQILVELSKPEVIRRMQIHRAQMTTGVKLGCHLVSRRFGVSLATAKRDLRALRIVREKLAARGLQ